MNDPAKGGVNDPAAERTAPLLVVLKTLQSCRWGCKLSIEVTFSKVGKQIHIWGPEVVANNVRVRMSHKKVTTFHLLLTPIDWLEAYFLNLASS